MSSPVIPAADNTRVASQALARKGMLLKLLNKSVAKTGVKTVAAQYLIYRWTIRRPNISRMPAKPIKWTATLSQVREVSLKCAAELGYWTDRLKAEDLRPLEHQGQAQIMILSAAARFMGLSFRELSISVVVQPNESHAPDSAFLLTAWNSRRFFAFSERVFFKTPYSYGDVRVGASVPASLQLTVKGTLHFAAEMGAGASDRAISIEQAGWEGPVFFPAPGLKTSDRKYFFARLQGPSQNYPFLPSTDSLTIKPGNAADALAALLDSHFTPQQWSIRPDAVHAKSKTYLRSESVSLH